MALGVTKLWSEGSRLIFEEYRVVFLTVSSILVLLAASPALSWYLVLPRTEFFSEVWILGSNHTADNYPFNVTAGEDYTIFLGIANRLGFASHYEIRVKLRNQTQSAPDSFNRTSSNLPAIYGVHAFVADETVWEIPVTFSFDSEYQAAESRVEIYSLILNEAELEPDSLSVFWDSDNNGFFVNLFFELWTYNRTVDDFVYHERFVGLWMNMTTS